MLGLLCLIYSPKDMKREEKLWLTNVFATGLTVLSIQGLEAPTTVGPTVFHDVPLTTQNGFTFKAGKVLHVPVTALCLRALIIEDNLKNIWAF